MYKRSVPFKTTVTPESNQKRLKAIKDAMSDMDVDKESPSSSPTRAPIRPGINFPKLRSGASTSTSPTKPINVSTTPSKKAASEARLAAIRHALTPQSPNTSTPISARPSGSHSHTPNQPPPSASTTQNGSVKKSTYNLADLGIDLSTTRPSVPCPSKLPLFNPIVPRNTNAISTDQDSEDELWDSFDHPPESSQDQIANDLLASSPVDESPSHTIVNGFGGSGKGKGKERAMDIQTEEDEFWTVRPSHKPLYTIITLKTRAIETFPPSRFILSSPSSN
jgi:hypothetical protein